MIKDYLHFYIGQDVDVLRKYPNGDSQVLKLVLDAYTYMNIVDGSFKDSEVKLVLRPLSDMSEEEILEVCKLASPEAFGDYRFSKWKVQLDPKSDNVWQAWEVTNERSSYCFMVYAQDGDVYLYDGDDIDTSLINANYRFWYLSKGFDLFGLQEKGLAIYKTDVK